MEGEEGSSSRPANNNDHRAPTRLKTGCLSFAVSIREMFSHCKAAILGQARYLTARNEEEAAKAELMATKMQVQATGDAENAKQKIHNS